MLLASPQYCAGTRGLEVAGGKVWSPSSGTTEMPSLVARRRPASGGYGEEGVRDAELGCASLGVGGFSLPAQSAAPTSAVCGAGRRVGRRCLKVGWGGDASRRSSICSMIKQN